MDSYYDDGGCCVVHPDSTDLILTGGRGPLTQTNWSFVISRSTDGGLTWARYNPEPASAGFCYSLAVAPARTNVIYAGGHVAGPGAVYRSVDFGSTWEKTSTAPSAAVYSLEVDQANAARVLAATPDGVFLSTDSAETWTSLYAADLRAVLQYPGSPDTLVAGGVAGVSISVDGGSTWNPMNSGLDGREVSSLAFADHGGAYLIAGTVGGSCYAWQFDAGVAERPLTKDDGPGTVDGLRAWPNPFVSHCVVVGQEREQFSVFDHAGRQVAAARGDRIGAGLPAGIYFLRPAQAHAQVQAPVRVVKTK